MPEKSTRMIHVVVDSSQLSAIHCLTEGFLSIWPSSSGCICVCVSTHQTSRSQSKLFCTINRAHVARVAHVLWAITIRDEDESDNLNVAYTLKVFLPSKNMTKFNGIWWLPSSLAMTVKWSLRDTITFPMPIRLENLSKCERPFKWNRSLRSNDDYAHLLEAATFR